MRVPHKSATRVTGIAECRIDGGYGSFVGEGGYAFWGSDERKGDGIEQGRGPLSVVRSAAHSNAQGRRRQVGRSLVRSQREYREKGGAG